MIEPPKFARILAVRHGETDWNVATRIQGHLDVALNETGRYQAQRLAHALADEALDAIYASDLRRAHETALALVRSGRPSVALDHRLRERAFGEFEGFTWAEIETRWPEGCARWRQRDIDFAPAGGESLRQFYARSIEAVTRLASAHLGQTIALVAHGGVMDCLYRAAARVSLQAPRSWQLGNASLNRLLYTAQGFTLVGWSDTSHLEDGSRDESVDVRFTQQKNAPLVGGA